MVRIDKFTYGEVRYCDCLDKELGLPSLKDKIFDLCLTDPPYNVDIGKLAKDLDRLTKEGGQYKNKLIYNDKIEDYYNWCKLWFFELERLCNKIVFTPGIEPFKIFWLNYRKPQEILIHYKRNCVSFTHSVRFNRYEPILCYGKFRPFEFRENVLDIPLNNSFLNGNGKDFIHPAVKVYQLWFKLIKRMKPLSVIDCFLGSGTTAEVCEKLGIPWLGFEIMEEYKHDIDLRLRNIKREPQQTDLLKFNGGFLYNKQCEEKKNERER